MERLYPRPQLKREKWINLNGKWDFSFDDQEVGIKHKWFNDYDYDKTILVPFPYQSKKSTINDQSVHDHIWYHRTFRLSKQKDQLILLHFGAVDYQCEVYIDGCLVGQHTGGSTSFKLDITSHVENEIEHDLTVYVYDPSFDPYISRGKQTWKKDPFECFYHRTSGIWQTVWIEQVSIHAIESFKMTADIDASAIDISLKSFSSTKKKVHVKVCFQGQMIAEHTIPFEKKACESISLSDHDLHLWTPEDPNLYDIEVEVMDDHDIVDKFETYMGMRDISIKDGQVFLNHKPYYLRLILDQGYYPDGLLSYSDEEALENDIKLAKQMGFNGCRKHEKIEAERFLYYADKIGYLVSLEMPSAYAYKPSQDFVKEWVDIVERDYNHPSVFMYVPFNESWGVRGIKQSKEMQDYITGFYYLTKSLDSSRIVTTNDGWEQTITDICAIHTYQHGNYDDLKKQTLFKQSIIDKDTLLSSIHTNGQKDIYVGPYTYVGEPIFLSEFGGISFANNNQDGWGYTGAPDKETLCDELKRIFNVVYDSEHLAGFCYTQLTDVEQEINGLLDYERKPKLNLEQLKKIINGT